EHGDRRHDDRVAERAEPDPPERAEVLEPADAERERGEHERHHRHEDHVEEDLPERVRDVRDGGVDPRGAGKEDVARETRRDPREEPDEDPEMKRPSPPGAGRHQALTNLSRSAFARISARSRSGTVQANLRALKLTRTEVSVAVTSRTSTFV